MDRLVQQREPTAVRLRALAALAQVTDPRVTSILLDAFEHYQDNRGVDLVKAMQRSQDPALVESLLRLSTHSDAAIRRGACEVLGTLGDHRSTPFLVERLADSDMWVRRAAGHALARLRDPRAADALQRRYEDYPDDDVNVRMALCVALRDLGLAPDPDTIRRRMQDGQ